MDPGVLCKDPGFLLKDPGVLLEDGMLFDGPRVGACNIYAMPGPAGVRPGPGRGPGVDFYVVFIR